MDQQFSAGHRPAMQTLVLSWMSHLEQEEAMLDATLESLQCVRAALLQGDLSALTGALQHQAHTARAAAELRLLRERLRDHAAQAMGVALESVTLTRLAERMPGQIGEQISLRREKLCRMAEEVQQINQGNAALVKHCLGFLQQLFLDITGAEQGGPSYDAGGRRAQSDCGSFIEARG